MFLTVHIRLILFTFLFKGLKHFKGLVSGDFGEDAWAIRYFASLGLEMIICQSFAANMGIYDERVGNLVLITKDAKITSRCKSQIELLIRFLRV